MHAKACQVLVRCMTGRFPEGAAEVVAADAHQIRQLLETDFAGKTFLHVGDHAANLPWCQPLQWAQGESAERRVAAQQFDAEEIDSLFQKYACVRAWVLDFHADHAHDREEPRIDMVYAVEEFKRTPLG